MSRSSLRMGICTSAFLSLVLTGYAQTITTFDVPDSFDTFPEAINPAGDVTGEYVSLEGPLRSFFAKSQWHDYPFQCRRSTGTSAKSINSSDENRRQLHRQKLPQPRFHSKA